MPLGTRDVLMIMRAQDQASAIIGKVGGAFGKLDGDAQKAAKKQLAVGASLMAVGAGIGAVGVAGIQMYAGLAEASMEYSKASALTLTQIDQTGVKLETIKDIGRNVARAIPAPFEQMQAALFDIFSSMDIRVEDSQKVLEAFSKAAVTGNTDVQTAGRATIAILNAWKLPLTDLNRVMDVQFQLVRKGVGTYEEFATTIGRSIPSAARAGQSIETLAGMLAFLTRNGLSAAMASASAGRAFDAMSHPGTVKKAKELFGIDLKTPAGEYKTMSEVVQLLHNKLGNLTAPDRAKALQELFKGSGGTIQARRFWDLAITNTEDFLSLVDAMKNASGEMDESYKVMFEQPQNQMQLFKNNLEIIRTEMGDEFLPIVNKLLKVGVSLLQWFGNLSPRTKQLITWFGIIASVVMVVVGAVLALVGTFMAFAAMAAMMGVTLATVGLVIGGILLAIGALIAIGYLLVTNWDTVKRFAVEVWQTIYGVLSGFVGWLDQTFGPIVKAVFEGISTYASFMWSILEPIFNFWGKVITDVVVPAAKLLWDVWQKSMEIIATVTQFAWDVISTIFQMIYGIIYSQTAPALRFLRDIWNDVWRFVMDLLKNNVMPGLKILESWWKTFWREAGEVVTAAWSVIGPAIKIGVNAAIEGINGAIRAAGDGVNAIVDMYNRIPGAPKVDKVSIPQIPKLHRGGLVTSAFGIGSGEVLRVLQSGEGVVNRQGMQSLGSNGLASINRGEGAGVVLSEGAVQIIVKGDVTDENAQRIADEVARQLRELLRELKYRKAS